MTSVASRRSLLLGLDLHIAQGPGILIPELLFDTIENLFECRNVLPGIDSLFDCVANVLHLLRELRLVLHVEPLASGDIALPGPA
jgi:hypothetical protein